MHLEEKFASVLIKNVVKDLFQIKVMSKELKMEQIMVGIMI
tara:strand:- start:912 stop:1034 length:123 start_codon:yes stop_codon:yes gene_type:complete